MVDPKSRQIQDIHGQILIERPLMPALLTPKV